MVRTQSLLARYSIGIVIYTLVVILWGAFVRATFSGDGCGTHWPTCGGEIIPIGASLARKIEYSHRVTSGLIGPLGIIWLWLCYRASGRGAQIRKTALGVMFFIVTEALVGARLVLKGYVAHEASAPRAMWMSIHLVNTFTLLALMVWTAWLATGRPTLKFRNQGSLSVAIAIGLVAVALMGISGAIAALGDTLYPATSLAEGLRKDLSAASPWLIRLRMYHPLISTSVGVYIVFLMSFVTKLRPFAALKRLSVWVVGAFAFQYIFGIANLLASAPVAMQITHLLLADVIWLGLIVVAAMALQSSVANEIGDAEPSEPVERPQPRELINAYIALTKPRVVSLLLFTTITAAFIAKSGWPGGWLLLALFIGGYCAAGSANAINMVYDRDIDVRMARTAKRPTVTNFIPSHHVMLFALVLEVISFALLAMVANVLTAMLALAGLLFYVFVYTMGLKRRTWHNIVIGGAAGAFPPLVGYAGVTGNLSPLAWALFGIIFLWTPVHFWALALLIQDDYRDAGVPMLPVIHGDRATVIQIAVYSVLTALVSILPLWQGEAGMIYLVSVSILNIVLFVRTFQLFQTTGKAQAKSLFKFSMVYLALLFLMIAIDRAKLPLEVWEGLLIDLLVVVGLGKGFLACKKAILSRVR